MERPLPSRPQNRDASLSDPALGIPAQDAQPALQSDCYKELVNKLAWAIGSTYGVPYKTTRCPARLYALGLAQRVFADHGYPQKIGYPKK